MNRSDFTASNPYGMFGAVADAPVDARATFIRKTYTHLALAIYAFAAVCWFMFQTLPIDRWMQGLGQAGNMSYIMLALMLGFMVVSWVANSWAHSETSVNLQYAGLVLYVFAQAVMFVPILWIAQHFTLQYAGQNINVIGAAGVTTLLIFGGLTAFVWLTKTDFSFLGAALGIGGMAALAAIVASVLFGFHLGIWFSVLMVAFAAGYILYDTSNIMHHYRPTQHVAASLALFASVALLFWYVLRIMISLSSRE